MWHIKRWLAQGVFAFVSVCFEGGVCVCVCVCVGLLQPPFVVHGAQKMRSAVVCCHQVKRRVGRPSC